MNKNKYPVATFISTFSHNTDMRFMPTNCMIPVGANLTALKKVVIDAIKFGSDFIIICCYPHLVKFFEFHIGSHLYTKFSSLFESKRTRIPILYVSPNEEDLIYGVSPTEACLKSIVYFHSAFKQFESARMKFKYYIHYWDCIAYISKKYFEYSVQMANTPMRRKYWHHEYDNICLTYKGKSFLDGYNYPFMITYDTVEKALKNIEKQKKFINFGKKNTIYNTKFITNKKIFSFLNIKDFFKIEVINAYLINTNRKYFKYIKEVVNE
jgi:hypothetical protein